MRAYVVTGPRRGGVQDVPEPVAGPGQAVVAVSRVGLCGTDVEFFTGEMAYLHQGQASYPLRLGHEWCGTVEKVGAEADARWVGQRVTGDTMLGCGHCARCLAGRPHVCADRYEIGIRGGWPGALAERLLVPVSALHSLPDTVDDVAGALVEPGAGAMRAVVASGVGPGARLLVLGPGTIGRLAAEIALARGAAVDVVGPGESLPDRPYDAVIDATNDAESPARALDAVEPGGRLVLIGLAGTASTLDTRRLVLKDVTAVGILGGSDGLAAVIDEYASGRVRPNALVAATVPLDRVGDVLGGWRPADSGEGPKVHVDPSA